MAEMIYGIRKTEDTLVKRAYREGMKSFNSFFPFKWTYNLPNICILKNRKEIDVFQYKSKQWVIGFAMGNVVYALARRAIPKESSHKSYSPEKYAALIKHELCHLFYNILTDGCRNPRWLNEGLSICLSGQLAEKKPVQTFSKFIDAYDVTDESVYAEGGAAVKILLDGFGKKKLLTLISRSKTANDKRAFARIFKSIYGFDLTYGNFNNMAKK